MKIGDIREAYYGVDLGHYDGGIYKNKIVWIGPMIITETNGWYWKGRIHLKRGFTVLRGVSQRMSSRWI